MNDSSTILKFDDGDETAYREEVKALAEWCQENSLSLNVSKTKLLIEDYRKQDGRTSLLSSTVL